MSNRTMYAIKDDNYDIIDEVESLDGELTPDLEARLKINEEEREEKSLAYIQKIEEKESYVERLDKEIKRLTQMKKNEQRSIDFLKGSLVHSVGLFGEYDAGFYRVKTRTSQSVNILDEAEVSDQFKKAEEKVKIDKTAIKKAINSGDYVPGAEIVENHSLSLGKPTV